MAKGKPMKTYTFFLNCFALFIALCATAMFSVASAATSVVLDGYTIDYIGMDLNGTVGTFTYAVTADPATNTIQNGLSHWTIGYGNCAVSDVIAPVTTSDYVTPVSVPACGNGSYSCQAATYTQVEYGLDPTTSVNGVKFGDVSDFQLSKENAATHIFQIQIDNVIGTQDVGVGVKTKGNTGPSDQITGPLCDNPTAVNLSSASASTEETNNSLMIMAVIVFAAITGLIIGRRHTI